MPKKLGQHYLHNKAAIKKIIGALELERGDIVIEIGPGRGALTLPILHECRRLNCKLVAVEKDFSLVEQLKSYAKATVNEFKNSEIIQGDALKLINSLTQKLINYKLVGNIPYYITGRLLRILSELRRKPKLTVLTIQKEVAERITAQPPKMNLLAAVTQFWCEPKIIGGLKPRDFSPAPRIDSSIIKLIPKRIISYQLLGTSYFRFIRILFKQPRKTIFNNLRAGSKLKRKEVIEILEKQGLSGQERPQNLTLETLISLSSEFSI